LTKAGPEENPAPVVFHLSAMQRITVNRAIGIGLLVINVPVMLLMFAPMGALLPYMSRIEKAQGLGFAIVLFFASFAAGFVVAWLWWALAVPKWRLWAYRLVIDLPLLRRRAVEVGLTWPDGHFLARTEIKSAAHAARERAFEQRLA
jgi:hypothetical protein